MMIAVRCGDWAGCGQQVCNLQLVLLPFNPTKNMRAILSSAHFLKFKVHLYPVVKQVCNLHFAALAIQWMSIFLPWWIQPNKEHARNPPMNALVRNQTKNMHVFISSSLDLDLDWVWQKHAFNPLLLLLVLVSSQQNKKHFLVYLLFPLC